MRKLFILALLTGCPEPAPSNPADLSMEGVDDLPGSHIDMASSDIAEPYDLKNLGPIFSCDQRGAPNPVAYCSEFTDVDKATADSGIKPVCTGTWAEAPCNRAGSLGACSATKADGGVYANAIWHFSSQTGFTTTTQVMNNCATNSQTYLAP